MLCKLLCCVKSTRSSNLHLRHRQASAIWVKQFISKCWFYAVMQNQLLWMSLKPSCEWKVQRRKIRPCHGCYWELLNCVHAKQGMWHSGSAGLNQFPLPPLDGALGTSCAQLFEVQCPYSTSMSVYILPHMYKTHTIIWLST